MIGPLNTLFEEFLALFSGGAIGGEHHPGRVEFADQRFDILRGEIDMENLARGLDRPIHVEVAGSVGRLIGGGRVLDYTQIRQGKEPRQMLARIAAVEVIPDVARGLSQEIEFRQDKAAVQFR